MLNKTRKKLVAISGVVLTLVSGLTTVLPQARTYPKEIRGYKVERTVVEIKKPETKSPPSGNGNGRNRNDGAGQSISAANSEGDVDELTQLGKPPLARITPLAVTFEVPIVVSPVKQSGHVDFLVFEDMIVNGTSVNVDEYLRVFHLRHQQPLVLRE